MIELLLEAERSLSYGRIEHAESLYQQVAAADPHNSIAVVGLARIALERADDAGALTLARRALAIDAENVAAQRLVERMEEVLTTRGEPLPAAPEPPARSAAPDHAASHAEPRVPDLSPDAPTDRARPASTPTASSTSKARSLLDRIRGR